MPYTTTMAHTITRRNSTADPGEVKSVSLLTDGSKRLLITHLAGQDQHTLYRLQKLEDVHLKFYAQTHVFTAASTNDRPLADRDYGVIGSSIDLTGRMMTRCLSNGGRRIHSEGSVPFTLQYPVYECMGTQSSAELKSACAGFSKEQADFPYAAISLYSLAVGEAGDDGYLNTLLYMSGGYGVLAEINAIAGRAKSDCVSPEFHYKASKVRLDGLPPIQRLSQADIVSGAAIADWSLTATPEVTMPINARFNSPQADQERIDALIQRIHSGFSKIKT